MLSLFLFINEYKATNEPTALFFTDNKGKLPRTVRCGKRVEAVRYEADDWAIVECTSRNVREPYRCELGIILSSLRRYSYDIHQRVTPFQIYQLNALKS